MERVGVCEDSYRDVESPLMNLKVTHFNRTMKLLSYDVTFRRPIDENIEFDMQVKKLTSLGWRKLLFLPKIRDICRFGMNHFRQLYIPYVTALGLENPEKCPIPAGSYSMKEFPLDTSVTYNLPPVMRGRTVATLVLQDPKEKISVQCMEITMIIE
ncbi:unnamed protein product [Phaedon cochleariae]|uniref:MD-2-related lipid-recognition domain-containing protein n=1 Tax=Phaedon cochleariae TaxID=80249 RepID=A0A9N9SHH0_PHACE|nr:unnamed protein product [Phaedon cochleariae]